MSDELVLPTADAERLDRRIRLLTNSIGDSLSKLYDLIEQAKAGQIHLALGYASWTAYVADACRINVKIGREQRRKIVGWLSGEGMSQRAIADVVGSSVATVNADLGVQNRTPEPRPDDLVNEDVVDPQEIEHGLNLLVDDGLMSAADAEQIARGVAEIKSTGCDGKQYPARRQPDVTPRRRPIADEFSHEILKWHPRVDRIAKLAADDRVARNVDALAGYRNDLIRFRDTIDAAIDQLGAVTA
ncbi:hypothetical protein [Mycolicibacterium gilvum]|uniref:Uncharacterized protein n=1 Tax=Mycolicibacterium gilvum TaxID=1804 RepID=A0A378SN41_9MYCO|nr:hypothetical protein [Mycolicibacterium gilvum]MCV7057272.1 hypothetical protein [Mycolicibacterium gilvum]STZ43548.1 Uncharacterised protein [Mycolicibacterium gilvum]